MIITDIEFDRKYVTVKNCIKQFVFLNFMKNHNHLFCLLVDHALRVYKYFIHNITHLCFCSDSIKRVRLRGCKSKLNVSVRTNFLYFGFCVVCNKNTVTD